MKEIRPEIGKLINKFVENLEKINVIAAEGVHGEILNIHPKLTFENTSTGLAYADGKSNTLNATATFEIADVSRFIESTRARGKIAPLENPPAKAVKVSDLLKKTWVPSAPTPDIENKKTPGTILGHSILAAFKQTVENQTDFSLNADGHGAHKEPYDRPSAYAGGYPGVIRVKMFLARHPTKRNLRKLMLEAEVEVPNAKHHHETELQYKFKRH